ncbi:T9SS type A sorting domain-containing protein [Agriterribacter sp.]|uniref:T9SS type A sorting domain-containing protein n=1 Tax=Agriterribacter sp. TaxID=2821509 RepID=UPI002B745F4D|nr:T9SS type A sorting domain-containing protein [Agriterribacter sp.]HRO47243.1 T9SS type A sorting domain-containing protein [Agriterribacter sp.]HRQ19265.1 T9SS type A sorting domain-containing protein [Agriterribacter sp.]
MKQLYLRAVAILLLLHLPLYLLCQPPANDECIGATIISIVTFGSSCAGSVSASTAGATRSVPAPSCTSSENDDDIWYQFTATTTSVVLRFSNTINIGTGGSAIIGYALYETACPANRSALQCNNIGSAGAGFQIIGGLTEGNTYFLRFWSTLTAGNAATFDFCIQEATAPANDECANATEVTTRPVGTICNSGTPASTIGAGPSTPALSCPNDYTDDDIWYSFAANTSAIRINFSNARLATSTSGNGALGYALYDANCGTGAALSCSENIGSGSGSELVGGLVPGNRYLLRFFSYAGNRYITFDFCLVDVDLPINDECVNASELGVSNSFCTTPLLTSLANATTSPGFGPPACAELSGSEDVWYKATVPASGNLVIQTSVADNNINDLIMEAYTGNCESLILLTCDDDGNPEPVINSLHPRIELTGRTPGEIIFIRILGKGSINFGPFTICAWDASVLAAVSAGGNCIAGNTITINAASGNHYMWVPVFDASGNIIAEINANGNDLGTVNTSLFVHTAGTIRHNAITGISYLDRNVAIRPTGTGSAKLRIYFEENEFAALRIRYPSLTLQQLDIHKDEEVCQEGIPATPVLIEHDRIENYNGDHFIEFSTASFSSFYIMRISGALPVQLISFTASCKNNTVVLKWATATETNNKKFEVEKSSDGTLFEKIADIPGTGNSNSVINYSFTDEQILAATAFYRLKQVDSDGKFEYSKVVRAVCNNDMGIRVFPNPVSSRLEVEMDSRISKGKLIIVDAAGRQRMAGEFGSLQSGKIIINTKTLAPGIYFLRLQSPEIFMSTPVKFIKR